MFCHDCVQVYFEQNKFGQDKKIAVCAEAVMCSSSLKTCWKEPIDIVVALAGLCPQRPSETQLPHNFSPIRTQTGSQNKCRNNGRLHSPVTTQGEKDGEHHLLGIYDAKAVTPDKIVYLYPLSSTKQSEANGSDGKGEGKEESDCKLESVYNIYINEPQGSSLFSGGRREDEERESVGEGEEEEGKETEMTSIYSNGDTMAFCAAGVNDIQIAGPQTTHSDRGGVAEIDFFCSETLEFNEPVRTDTIDAAAAVVIAAVAKAAAAFAAKNHIKQPEPVLAKAIPQKRQPAVSKPRPRIATSATPKKEKKPAREKTSKKVKAVKAPAEPKKRKRAADQATKDEEEPVAKRVPRAKQVASTAAAAVSASKAAKVVATDTTVSNIGLEPMDGLPLLNVSLHQIMKLLFGDTTVCFTEPSVHISVRRLRMNHRIRQAGATPVLLRHTQQGNISALADMVLGFFHSLSNFDAFKPPFLQPHLLCSSILRIITIVVVHDLKARGRLDLLATTDRPLQFLAKMEDPTSTLLATLVFAKVLALNNPTQTQARNYEMAECTVAEDLRNIVRELYQTQTSVIHLLEISITAWISDLEKHGVAGLLFVSQFKLDRIEGFMDVGQMCCDMTDEQGLYYIPMDTLVVRFDPPRPSTSNLRGRSCVRGPVYDRNYPGVQWLDIVNDQDAVFFQHLIHVLMVDFVPRIVYARGPYKARKSGKTPPEVSASSSPLVITADAATSAAVTTPHEFRVPAPVPRRLAPEPPLSPAPAARFGAAILSASAPTNSASHTDNTASTMKIMHRPHLQVFAPRSTFFRGFAGAKRLRYVVYKQVQLVSTNHTWNQSIAHILKLVLQCAVDLFPDVGDKLIVIKAK